jgi:hypothetical protein
VQKGDREMTTCEMIEHVASARADAERAAARRRLLAQNDLRASLHLLAPQDSSPDPAPPQRRCGVWRDFERWLGRLLLPKQAAAQAPVLPVPGIPPRDSIARPLLATASA